MERRSVSSVITALILLLVPAISDAALVTFKMTLDELQKGKAVLQGSLLESLPSPGSSLLLDATYPAGDTRKDWSAQAFLFRHSDSLDFAVQISMLRHISDPPPHPGIGEDSPGPPLVGAGWSNLATGPPPSELVFVRDAFHDGPHKDIATITLFDLAPGLPTVLFGAEREIRLNVDFIHTPIPAASVLFGSAVFGLAMLGAVTRRAQYGA